MKYCLSTSSRAGISSLSTGYRGKYATVSMLITSHSLVKHWAFTSPWWFVAFYCILPINALVYQGKNPDQVCNTAKLYSTVFSKPWILSAMIIVQYVYHKYSYNQCSEVTFIYLFSNFSDIIKTYFAHASQSLYKKGCHMWLNLSIKTKMPS